MENKEIKRDMVNHPEHYASNCSLECIDVMVVAFGVEEVINFCTINAFKYLWRFKFKNGDEDVRKAKWYLDKATELLRKATHSSYLEDSVFSVKTLYDTVTNSKECEK